MDLHGFQLILLLRPDPATDYDEARLEQMQREHVAFYASLRAAGHVVTNGPVREQPDEKLRGIAIFAPESVARARELASRDPLVLAGRLEVQVMTWWCPPGTMVTNGLPIQISG
jgi:uncharacterized protein YciI